MREEWSVRGDGMGGWARGDCEGGRDGEGEREGRGRGGWREVRGRRLIEGEVT